MNKITKNKDAVNDNPVPMNLVGIDGNAFMILGAFNSMARRHGWDKADIDAVMVKATSGDYDNLLRVIMANTVTTDVTSV